MSGFHFVYPWVMLFLWLSPAFAVLRIILKRDKNRRLKLFSKTALTVDAKSPWREITQTVLITLAIALMVVAAARPQYGERAQTVFERGRDLVILLDVSRSMLAEDLYPNRLERAKVDLIDLIKELSGDRASLTAFRNRAANICPFTTDYSFLLTALSGVDISSAPAGPTDIGSAIETALLSFEEESGSHKAIIMVSDGEDLSGRALEAAKKAGDRSIPVFTVGFGNRRGSTIPNPDNPESAQKYKDEEVITKLDNDALNQIAKASGGAYIPIETGNMRDTTLGAIYKKHLRNISAAERQETLQKRKIDRYQWFLMPAFMLILTSCFLSRGRTAPRIKRSSAAALALLITGILSQQASLAEEVSESPATNSIVEATYTGRQGARSAQMFYRTGLYEKAAEAFIQSADSSTAPFKHDMMYNAALALYKAKKYKEAAEILKSLPADDRRKETDLALGCSLYRSLTESPEGDEKAAMSAQEKLNLLKEAGEMFRISAAESENSSAEENLRLVMKSLPEAEEAAERERIESEYGEMDAAKLLTKMLTTQREINKDIAAARTNDTPETIYMMERTADKMDENAALWSPLKAKLAAGIDQSSEESAQRLQQIMQSAEASRDSMLDGAEKLRNLDFSGEEGSQGSQALLYNIWKAVAPFDMLLDESMRRQTNALLLTQYNADKSQTIAEQTEAQTLTELFKARFEQKIPEEGTTPPPAQDGSNSSTNSGGITAETRAQIVALAEETIETQKQIPMMIKSNRSIAIQAEKSSLENLKKIKELLPKNNKNENSPQDQKKDKNEDNNQDQKEKEKEKKDSDDNSSPEKEPEDKDNKEKKEKETPAEQKNAGSEKMMKMALEREKEHEEELKKRSSRVKFIRNERDW